MNNLEDNVEVFTDENGIPHIHSTSRQDLYSTLGYISAQERMLQIELMRRVAKGQLSEAFGEDALPVDKLFLTLGTDDLARRNASEFELRKPEGYEEVQAYISGINEFLEHGKLPFELTLAGLDPAPYTLEDVFAIAAYMAYGFALAPKTDPLVNRLANDFGEEWVNSLWLNADSTSYSSPVFTTDSNTSEYSDILNLMPSPIFHGSNSWAVNGSKTASGKAMLCTDTHIGYGLPQVWYEAHLKCDDFEFYGNFLPGIPFALVGHNRHLGWGLTMFENDDMDFYLEELTSDSTSFRYDQGSYPVQITEKIIKVKGKADFTLIVKRSKHGPLVQNVMSEIRTKDPVALRWDYALGENRLLEAFRSMNNATNLGQFQSALPLIHGPGLNVVYADKEDNIAWWACTRMIQWPEHVNSKFFMCGDLSIDEPGAWLPFELNPHSINPESGIVASSNEQPTSSSGQFYPGYYVPPSRVKRVRKILNSSNSWDTESMQVLLLDVVCDEDRLNAEHLLQLLSSKKDSLTEKQLEAADLLNWDGAYTIESTGALLFQHLNYQLLLAAFSDEMTESEFEQFMHLHWMKRLAQELYFAPDHIAWDNVKTDQLEHMDDYLLPAFKHTVNDLILTYGEEIELWTWGIAHQVELKHPLAINEPLRKLLNIGPFPAPGGNETINQSGFIPNAQAKYAAHFGPQMRIIIDFDNVDNSVSITPSGQSAHRWSPYYDNQFDEYLSGKFRNQYMHWGAIKQFDKRHFITGN
jgi:penicillin G amidase